jgi:hypothetical protein
LGRRSGRRATGDATRALRPLLLLPPGARRHWPPAAIE